MRKGTTANISYYTHIKYEVHVKWSPSLVTMHHILLNVTEVSPQTTGCKFLM